MSRFEDLKPIGTNIHDITDKIPSKLPDPKLNKVQVDNAPNASKLDVSLNFAEKLAQLWRSIWRGVQEIRETISDVARIIAFLQTWGWAIAGLLLVFGVLIVLKLL